MIPFLSYKCISNFLSHSLKSDFLDDDAEDGKDLDDIDFGELNKIGEAWAAGKEDE
jgi:hypothetical protein